jgi:hypothetical protein
MFGLIASSIMLKTNPITLIIQFFGEHVGYYTDDNFPFNGILSVLSLFGINDHIVLFGSMIIGIILILYGYFKLKNIDIKSKYIREIVIFAPSIICSMFWCYGWNLDRMPLSIIVLLLMFMFMNHQSHIVQIFFTLATIQLSPLFYQIVNTRINHSDVLEQAAIAAGTTASIFFIIGYTLFINLFTRKSFIEEINKQAIDERD